jgi:hypothetical protein
MTCCQVSLVNPTITIDRNNGFDRGFINAVHVGMTKIVEEDQKSLEISELEPDNLVLRTGFFPGESGEQGISCQERIARLHRDGSILCDAKFFEFFRDNPSLAIEMWAKPGKVVRVFFEGTQFGFFPETIMADCPIVLCLRITPDSVVWETYYIVRRCSLDDSCEEYSLTVKLN